MAMIPQMSLFNTSPQVAGFKLDYMEVWNWGTFDKEIYRLTPQGNNSLLTGANASGKSTLIDALLTLLVPLKRQRFYNQSSGVEKKGNRTEASYFFGNYGQQQEGDSGITSLRLRGKNARSVLLATFNNVDNRIVTLFQVRYYSGEELKVVFGISHKPLTISDNFNEFDSKGVWRKHLEKEFNSESTKRFIEFFDGPNAYQEKMIKVFGMRSDKALTLFNQIVGVKVLDDLDTFIRGNMLEEQSAEEKYQELRGSFQSLMDAKTNIDKTKEQIKQLKPIDELANELQNVEKEIKELEHEKSLAAYWFTTRTIELCDDVLTRCKSDLQKIEDEINGLKKGKKVLEEQKSTLEVAIQTDAVGQEIKNLEKDIRILTESRDNRKEKSDAYNKLAQKLGFTQEPDASTFDANRTQAKKEKERLQKQIDDELSEKKRHIQNDLDKIGEDIGQHVETIKYLLEHKNNISGRVAEIRDEILENIGATTEEIPFVGELISVKDDEREWEFAIERILHNFALRLIVPEKYYRKVNEYVNGHNLKGRIVYHRYNGVESLREFENRHLSDDSLLNKIDLNKESKYIEWLEDRLYAEFNYACVDSLADFNHLREKAVTKAGLVKSKGGKHEKDDRPEIHQRQNYVLGWDNREKIAALKKEYDEFCNQQKEWNAELEQIESKKKELEERKDSFFELYQYEKFTDIDWQSCSQKINEKSKQKKQLEDTNNKVKALQKQLEGVKHSLEENEKQKDHLIKKQTLAKDREDKTLQKRKDNVDALLLMENADTDEFEARYPDLQSVDLDGLDAKRTSIQTFLEESIKNLRGLKNKKESDCKDKIRNFKYPSEEITSKYRDWRSDVNSLPEDVEYVNEYQLFFKRLYDEDLPSFEGRFNKYLQETIANSVLAFKMFFQNWEESINRTVKQLNLRLKDIDFNTHPYTYIQLESNRKLNVDVNDFRKLLLDAIPNLHEVDSSIDGRRVHFEQHIEPLMLRLQDEQWRKNVMDVRGWFTYKAVEFFKEDDQKRNTYESMGQLSGGEKAQLTYTILGSAIAYQFGLTKQGYDSSFRFIAIDEAFRAQDEEKAHYLISLCKQLHLQLLVVTPSDNIHIVENDISFVHYVERKGNRSVLYNMPINEFKEERQKSFESE